MKGEICLAELSSCVKSCDFYEKWYKYWDQTVAVFFECLCGPGLCPPGHACNISSGACIATCYSLKQQSKLNLEIPYQRQTGYYLDGESETFVCKNNHFLSDPVKVSSSIDLVNIIFISKGFFIQFNVYQSK